MNYADIKTFSERCEEHPDHQDGIVSNLMLVQRMHEEIEELRAYIEGKKWVGLTEDEVYRIAFTFEGEYWKKISNAIEAKLKEKNT